ncbi:MAG: PepSY-associated TM helix domain-containing protein, partial [Pseudomonadota bacterium]
LDRADVAAPLVPLTSIVDEAESRWETGNGASSMNIYSPGDTNARVQVSRVSADGSILGDSMVFSGATGEFVSRQDGAPYATLGFAASMIALHEGLFAGPLLRWLYFFTGLLGCVMIATGAIYWVVKRKPKTYDADVGLGYRFVEHMNVATIVGLISAITVFFLANRLLPVEMEGRADWEIHCMFITWGLMFAHAILRPLGKAWREQCAITGVLLLSLPVVNALTTDVHLGVTIASGDWVRAGFDLTAIASGLIALLAFKMIKVEDRVSVETQTVKVATNPQPNPIGGGGA